LEAEQVNGLARLTVVDDGPGVAAEHLAHVFERFYRIEGGDVASGSGLGLAIARELAALMGGDVELVSAAGRTAITLTLPAAPERFHVETEPTATVA
jgi:signal transduction histidine kinase